MLELVIILSKGVSCFFCADVIALSICLAAKDVGCKPCCSDVIEHKGGKDVILPIANALVLCAIILLRCY